MDDTALSQATDRFIEEMGLITQSGGGPRIAGRILGLMVIAGESLSLHDMAERLKISRASASTNARLLADRGILRLHARSGDRQDYYVLEPGLKIKVLADLAAEMRRNAETISVCASEIQALSDAIGSRVADLADFYGKSANILQDWADRFRAAENTPK